MYKNVKEFIKSGVENYLESKRGEDVNYHVLQEIFPVERRVRAIIGGLETSFGTTVWEPLAKYLAQENGFNIKNEKDFKKPKNLPQEVTDLINSWEKKREESKEEISLDEYIKELRKVIKNLDIDYSKDEYTSLTSGQGIDIWLEKDGIEYIADIKTTQINARDGKSLNKHILKWYAYRVYKDPDVKIRAFIAIPFNPFEKPWQEKIGSRAKPLIFDKDIITDQKFWELISGRKDTYENIIKSFKELKTENLNERYKDIIYGDNSHLVNTIKNEKIKLDFGDEQYIWKEECTKYVDKENRQYTCVDLFSGAGGLALGLEEAGFRHVGLIELDKYACGTLRLNRPNWNVIQGDVVEIAENGIRNYINKDVEVDLLSGGYPCQAFRYAGKKLGLEDVRGTVFYYYAKILEDLKPKVFIAESVSGLVSHDNGKTLQTMIDVFTEIGYNVTYKILNTENYGVAQRKQKVIIIGTRQDLPYVDFEFPKYFDYIPTLKQALKNVPKSEGATYSEKAKRLLDLVPSGACFADLPEEIYKDYLSESDYYRYVKRRSISPRRMSWDKPCLPLTGIYSRFQMEKICHPEETRPFTIRECARIQSFPDEWMFSGSMSQVYKQIGNAVPVKLGKAVGLSIADYLNKVEEAVENIVIE